MKTLLWFLLAAIGIYGLVAVLMYAGQRAMMYFPERVRTPPAAAGLPQAEEVILDTADGEHIIVWHAPPRGNKPVVIYFQGNGGSLRYRVARFASLIGDGYGVIALSYRGYGGSSGTPTERGLYTDADTAYAFAAARYAPEKLALWGESLGTALALAVAAEHKVGGVILESPFTSAAEVGQRAYWFMPVLLLIKDPYRSDLRADYITAPVLVMHGDADRVVPIEFGERLFSLIVAPKHFAKFAGGGHNDLDRFGAFDVAREFLAKM